MSAIAPEDRIIQSDTELHVGLDIPTHSARHIFNWAQNQDWPEGTKLEQPRDYHITLLYSPEGHEEHGEAWWLDHLEQAQVTIKGIKAFPAQEKGYAYVLTIDSEEVESKAHEMQNRAEAWGLPITHFESGYQPHITVAYGPSSRLTGVKPPNFQFDVGPSSVSPPRIKESGVTAAMDDYGNELPWWDTVNWGGLLNSQQIAERYGLVPSAISNYQTRYPDFPQSILPSGQQWGKLKLFPANQVDEWFKRRGQGRVSPFNPEPDPKWEGPIIDAPLDPGLPGEEAPWVGYKRGDPDNIEENPPRGTRLASPAPEPPHYRPHEKPGEKCSTCKMFDHAKGTCWGFGNKKVEPEAVCDDWYPEHKKSKIANRPYTHHNLWTGLPCNCPWHHQDRTFRRAATLHLAGQNINKVLKAQDKAFRTPEGEAFRQAFPHLLNEEWDPLAPYLAQRWKKGEIRLGYNHPVHKKPALYAQRLSDHRYDLDPGWQEGVGVPKPGYWTQLTPTQYSPGELNRWSQWFNARQHPTRQGVDIMAPDFSVHRMHAKVDEHQRQLEEERQLAQMNQLGKTVYTFPAHPGGIDWDRAIEDAQYDHDPNPYNHRLNSIYHLMENEGYPDPYEELGHEGDPEHRAWLQRLHDELQDEYGSAPRKAGWHIKNLTAEPNEAAEALEHEGRMMGHCIGSDGQPYKRLAEQGKIDAYSLRDPKGRPHVTWHYNSDGSLAEMFGPNDDPVKPEYQDMLNHWGYETGLDTDQSNAVGNEEIAGVPEWRAPDPESMEEYLNQQDPSNLYEEAINSGDPIDEETELYPGDPSWRDIAHDMLGYGYVGRAGQNREYRFEPSYVPTNQQIGEMYDAAQQAGHLKPIHQALQEIELEHPLQQGAMDYWNRLIQPHYDPQTGAMMRVPVLYQYQHPLPGVQWPAPQGSEGYYMQENAPPGTFARVAYNPEESQILDHLSLTNVAANLHYKFEEGGLNAELATDYAKRMLKLIGYPPDDITVQAALQAWQQLYPNDRLEEKPPQVEAPPTTPTRSWGYGTTSRTADYQGWSNWDTWHTKLMMDNERHYYDKMHNIVENGGGPEDLRQHFEPNLIGPFNNERLQEAQEWNAIDPDKRRQMVDKRDRAEFGDAAVDLGRSLFGPFGMNDPGEDDTAQLIDPQLVNWDEIHHNILSEYPDDHPLYQQYKNPQYVPDTLPATWSKAASPLAEPLEPHLTLYHGTTNKALDLARQRGGLHAWHPRDIANQVAGHYGLNADDLYNHPYFEFSRSAREGENMIYADTDPRVAKSYANIRSEQLEDALSTAHRMLYPEMYDEVQNPETSPHRDAFKNSYFAENQIQPQVVKLNIPYSALGDQVSRPMQYGYQPSGTMLIPAPVPLDWISAVPEKFAHSSGNLTYSFGHSDGVLQNWPFKRQDEDDSEEQDDPRESTVPTQVNNHEDHWPTYQDPSKKPHDVEFSNDWNWHQ